MPPPGGAAREPIVLGHAVDGASAPPHRAREGGALVLNLRLGIAKVDITPTGRCHWPASPRARATAPGSPGPSTRVPFFSQGDSSGTRCHALLVSADLIWWDSDRMPALRRQLRARWGLEVAAIVLHGTHSHSGPQTSTNLSPGAPVTDCPAGVDPAGPRQRAALFAPNAEVTVAYSRSSSGGSPGGRSPWLIATA